MIPAYLLRDKLTLTILRGLLRQDTGFGPGHSDLIDQERDASIIMDAIIEASGGCVPEPDCLWTPEALDAVDTERVRRWEIATMHQYTQSSYIILFAYLHQLKLLPPCENAFVIGLMGPESED